MSNPFATFRKNQTYWMAALVLVAILSFIIAPAIEMVTRSFRQGGSDNSIVAIWNGGQMTTKELEETMRSRMGLRNFLSGLNKKVVSAGGQPAAPLQGINDWQSGVDLCYSKILLTMAEKIGVEFDDNAADEFLKQFCNKKVSDSDFNELLTKSGLTIFEVRQMIKQDLIASTTIELLAGGSTTPGPDKLWKSFLKLNQKVKVEAYPILVSTFMDKVSKKPTDTQLQEIYDSGKSRTPHPDDAEPGFMTPDMAKVEYVESNFDTWFEREKAKITDEELKAEYEKQRAVGLLKVPVDYKAPAPATPPSDTHPTITPPGESTTPANPAAPASTESGAEKPATETTSPTASSTPEPNPPGADPTTATPPTTPPEPAPATNPEPTSPAPTAPAEPTPTPSENPNPSPAGDAPVTPGETSMNLRAEDESKVRLVSFVQEGTPAQEPTGSSEAAASPQEPAPATPASTSPAQEPTASATAPASTPAATAEVTTLDPAPPTATTPATTAPSTTPPTSPVTQDSNLAVAEPTNPATPPMRDMTFEEAREAVLRSLAEKKANASSVVVVAQVSKIMQDYTKEYRKYEAMKNSTLNNAELKSTKVEKPQRPNLKKFAEENGLVYGETDFIDRVALAVTNLGQSMMAAGMQADYVANQVTRPDFELFAASEGHFKFEASHLFFFWKTDAKAAYQPPLNEVRDQVEDSWNRIEARKLAEEAAVAMQKKVVAGEDPWAGLISENERSLVVTTDSFTWVSRFGAQLRATAVPKLDRIGDEFMKKVFSTEVGKFGVVANNPKSVYYVYRVLEKSPDVSELQNQFNSDPLRLQASKQLANMEGSLVNWQARLLEDLGVQFQQ